MERLVFEANPISDPDEPRKIAQPSFIDPPKFDVRKRFAARLQLTEQLKRDRPALHPPAGAAQINPLGKWIGRRSPSELNSGDGHVLHRVANRRRFDKQLDLAAKLVRTGSDHGVFDCCPNARQAEHVASIGR
jgi:hypothetical protein